MPDTLPLTHLVLYKHGVGTFTRQGSVDGAQLVLPFRAEEVDDALKSLTIRAVEGGQVTGIQYDTPTDRGEIPFHLNERHILLELLRELRGVAVTLTLDDQRVVSGRIVGTQDYPFGRERDATLVLLTGTATLQQAPIETIVHLRLDDQRLAAEVARYLDTSPAAVSHRAVRIGLAPGTTRLEVSYTIPSPVWRVSYRLVGQTTGDQRQALFQGWAIFDNRLGEDLEEVDVALVAGQPVSFRYDLTSSVIPPRRFVRDEARIAAGPIEFEGALPQHSSPTQRVFNSLAEDTDGPQERARPMRTPAQDATFSHTTDDNQLLRPDTVAEGRELDELFEYRLGRISVGAGESAMAPIAQHVSTYHRELLYNGAKHPDHPVVALRLRNETGLTLERGPITITEDGQYRGEAMLPFTRQDAEIVLAYAVELGITVRAETIQSTSLAGLSLAGAYLHLQRHLSLATTYTLFNRTAQQETVTLERARHGDTELTDTSPPDEETGEHRRWRVTCPLKRSPPSPSPNVASSSGRTPSWTRSWPRSPATWRSVFWIAPPATAWKRSCVSASPSRTPTISCSCSRPSRSTSASGKIASARTSPSSPPTKTSKKSAAAAPRCSAGRRTAKTRSWPRSNACRPSALRPRQRCTPSWLD